MQTITLPPSRVKDFDAILEVLGDSAVKILFAERLVNSLPDIRNKVEYSGKFYEIRDFLNTLQQQVKDYKKHEQFRTTDMVLPLSGRYWIVSTDDKSEPFALIHPYEFEDGFMSSLMVNLNQPNYRWGLATEHIDILENGDGSWSGPLHLTEITEEDFHKRIADGIDNIFKYREYRKYQKE